MADSDIPSKYQVWSSPSRLSEELVDEMLDRYITWRHDAAAAADAYARWSNASPPDKAWRFSDFFSALAREESSASAYALITKKVEQALIAQDRAQTPGSSPKVRTERTPL